MAQHAAHAVWRISGVRQEPLTILLVSLSSWDRDVLTWTLNYLAEMAPQSTPYLQHWRELLEDNEGPLRGRSFGLPSTCGPGGPKMRAVLKRLQESLDEELAAAARDAGERIRRASWRNGGME